MLTKLPSALIGLIGICCLNTAAAQPAYYKTPNGKINVYMDLQKKNILLEVNEKEWFYQSDDYTAESLAKVLEVPLKDLSATDGFLGKYWSSFKEPVNAIVEFYSKSPV